MVIDNEKEKTTFNTGAVRATGNGKGRFDLIPLEIYAAFLEADFDLKDGKSTMYYIGQFQRTGNSNALFAAMERFRQECDWSLEDVGLQLAIHFEEGEKKYPSDIIDGKICLNAYKGLPLNCFIDSACRHYLKWRKKLDDERHDRAVFWNLIMAIWTVLYREDCNNIYYQGFIGQAMPVKKESSVSDIEE